MTFLLAALLTNPAIEQSQSTSFFHNLITTVFDANWNVEHRLIIWAVIVVVLFLSGVGLPLPEDIPLTLAGFTAIKQAQDEFILWHYILVFSLVATPILLGDIIAYTWGKRYGLSIRDRFHFLRRVLSDKRLAKVQRWFGRYGAFAVFLGRQMAGVRFVTFFTAGSMRVPLPKFILFDFFGCAISVPVWLTLGVLASRYGQDWLHQAIDKVGRGFFIGVLSIVLILLIIAKIRQKGDSTGNSKLAKVHDQVD
ncbi:MAG: DedA family protein [Deltaproteobacteria bacterium]|nr:DedA family protein [Deltaproteobacteria bacterium]